jgi:hypothetical protein
MLKDGLLPSEVAKVIWTRYRYLNLSLKDILDMITIARNTGFYEGKHFTIARKGNTKLYYIH